MGAYEQKPGDIVAYKETDKRNDRAPDWKGTMIVPEGAKSGDKLEVAFWAKGEKGTMIAGAVKFPNQRNAGPGGQSDEAFPGRRQEGVAGSDNHGKGQDAGRRASYQASLNPNDDPFDLPPF